MSSITSHPVKNDKKKVVGSGVGWKLLVLEGTPCFFMLIWMKHL